MSNLSNLMQNGSVQPAEPEVFESMTEDQMSQIMMIAMEDAAIEEMQESVSNDGGQSILEGAIPEDLVVMEKTIVRMDKQAKKQRAYKLAILQCAKDDDNKDYKKLETIWKMEKYLMRRLEKRYAQKARSRMKQTAKKANGPGLVEKVKHALSKPTLTRSQRETQKALSGQTKIPSQVKSQFTSISAKIGNKI